MARPGFPVPPDEIEYDTGYRTWIYCTFYGDTNEEVVEKRRKYIEEYPSQGYDTQTIGRKIFRHTNGYYYVQMKRWSTCD
jgi:hypothetical protein